MVCPHKKIMTKIEETVQVTGTKKTTVKITFGECERANCPYFVLLTETCSLGKGRNK